MKKISKKLALNRETLRSLEDGNLREAAGGLPTDASCANSCDPASVRICPGSRRIC
jgi:hypothetical protein